MDTACQSGMQIITSHLLTGRRSAQSFGDVIHVGNDSLDTVSFALDLRLQSGHFVSLRTGSAKRHGLHGQLRT